MTELCRAPLSAGTLDLDGPGDARCELPEGHAGLHSAMTARGRARWGEREQTEATPVVVATAGRFELLKPCGWPECPEVADADRGGKYCEPHAVRNAFAVHNSDRVYGWYNRMPEGAWRVDAANMLAYIESLDGTVGWRLTEAGERALAEEKDHRRAEIAKWRLALREIPEAVRWFARMGRSRLLDIEEGA